MDLCYRLFVNVTNVLENELRFVKDLVFDYVQVILVDWGTITHTVNTGILMRISSTDIRVEILPTMIDL